MRPRNPCRFITPWKPLPILRVSAVSHGMSRLGNAGLHQMAQTPCPRMAFSALELGFGPVRIALMREQGGCRGKGREHAAHHTPRRTHLVAVTSTYWPGTKCPAPSSVPTGKTASLVTLNSWSLRFGGTPALRKWPSRGREVVRSGRLVLPSWREWRGEVEVGMGGVCRTTWHESSWSRTALAPVKVAQRVEIG